MNTANNNRVTYTEGAELNKTAPEATLERHLNRRPRHQHESLVRSDRR